MALGNAPSDESLGMVAWPLKAYAPLLLSWGTTEDNAFAEVWSFRYTALSWFL